MGTTFSDVSATPPITVSASCSCPTICEPTAPRPATTRSCEKFKIVAGMLDAITMHTKGHRPLASSIILWSGARPSTAADSKTIRATEGKDIHARSAQGPNLSFCSPVSNFCCNEALAARKTLARTASARPSAEKCMSPREHRTHPRTTRQVGRRSHRSNDIPSRRTAGTDMSGWVAANVSVKAMEHMCNTLFAMPMQVAADAAMGRIAKKNSPLLGTGMTCPVHVRL
mmetsp:Transcript_15195/g.43439  ORF Transcript_15195/g.43439 Transcript_15195/m.43439 type:complete len:228 (+) Transcript_15195:135-818(+)